MGMSKHTATVKGAYKVGTLVYEGASCDLAMVDALESVDTHLDWWETVDDMRMGLRRYSRDSVPCIDCLPEA